MTKTPDDLFAALAALGIKSSTIKHPPLFTVEQSRELRGRIPGGHTKNLFLRDKKGALYLVVALEDAVIDLKGLHRVLGASGRFSFGSADLLREVWGVSPGSVTPFGAINDSDGRVTVVLDVPMMEHELLNYLSPAGQHHDHGAGARRSRPVPRLDRPSAAHRAGLGARPGGRLTPIAFVARMTHLSRTEPGLLPPERRFEG